MMNQKIVSTIFFTFLIGLVFCHQNNYHQNKNDKNSAKHTESKVNYMKAAIPAKIFNCMNKLTLMRCMKLLLLARMESRDLELYNTGNATTDFLNHVIDSDDTQIPYNYYEVYSSLNETQLSVRLLKSFQKFFEGREIMLHFIPGIVVKVIPNTNNVLQFKLRDSPYSKNPNEARGDGDGIGTGGGGGLLGIKKNKGYGQYFEVGAPVMVFPAILFSSLLPFMIPALKMATVFATVINNAALFAGIMYLARQAAIENEKKQTIYFNPGYNRRESKY